MIKTYCDLCENEITGKRDIFENSGDHRHRMLKATIRGKYKLQVEIVTHFNAIENMGDFCKYCILDTIYKMDDRDDREIKD